MLSKKWLYEFICFLLMLNFFYEGIYKIAHFGHWTFWITSEPFLRSGGFVLKYLIPTFEILIAFSLLTDKKRSIGLYSIIIAEILSIMWIMSVYIFTNYLFWPYHALWEDPSWMQKMIFGLILSWLALVAIVLSFKTVQKSDIVSVLRSKPV